MIVYENELHQKLSISEVHPRWHVILSPDDRLIYNESKHSIFNTLIKKLHNVPKDSLPDLTVLLNDIIDLTIKNGAPPSISKDIFSKNVFLNSTISLLPNCDYSKFSLFKKSNSRGRPKNN